MAGTPDDNAYPGDASGHMNPELQNFVAGFTTPEGQEWAQGAAIKVQQYVTGRAIAKQAQDASDQLVTNLHDMKTSLASMAADDPGSTDLALGLAKDGVNAIAAPHDLPQEHIDNLVGHIHGAIVDAAGHRLAEVDRGSTHDFLDKYGDYLPDGGVDRIQNYAMTQEALRTEDARAAGLQNMKNAAQASVDAGAQWLKSLTDDNGGAKFPAGWSAQMFADPSMNIPTKMALHAAYLTLQHFGDPPQSDPDVLHGLVSRIADGTPPPQGEVLSHVGRGLTLADAGLLSQSVGGLPPDQSVRMQQLSGTLNAARERIAGDANGPAGQVALNRFTKYLMTGIHSGGNITDLLGPDEAAFSRFQPTARDAAKAVVPATARVPLNQIFNRSGEGRVPNTADQNEFMPGNGVRPSRPFRR